MQTKIDVEWWSYNDGTRGFGGGEDNYTRWHEPGAMLLIIIPPRRWRAWPADFRRLAELRAATKSTCPDDFNAINSESLQILLREFDTEVLPLPDDVMDALYESSQVAIQALVNSDPMAKKIAASYLILRIGADVS